MLPVSYGHHTQKALAMGKILLRRAGDQLAEAVKAGAVAGAVPAALIRVPLQLTAEVRAADVDGSELPVLILVDAELLPMQKDDAAVPPWGSPPRSRTGSGRAPSQAP